MTKKLTHNLPLKLLSLVLAVLVWLVVLNIEDPVYTKEFTDIPVTEINGGEITEQGKAYSYEGDNTVTVKVKGKTSILNRLTRDDFTAIADLSTLSITGAVNVDVSCQRYPSLEITPVGSSTVLKVDIEDLSEKSLNIKVVTKGETADNKYIGTGVATPNMVTISGPKSVVNKISEAVVYVNVTAENTTDITTKTKLVLQDSNGDAVTSSTMVVSESNIDVTVPIYDTKTVPVELNVDGDVADGYEMVEANYEPKEITIAGRKDDLADVDEIDLKDYDITDFKTDVEESLGITQNMVRPLPSEVVLCDPDATVALAIKIEKVKYKEIELSTAKISLTGVNSDYTYEKSSENEDDEHTVVFQIEGAESLVDKLTEDQFTAYVDISDYEPGTYRLPVSVVFEDDNVNLAAESYLDITIKGKDNN